METDKKTQEVIDYFNFKYKSLPVKEESEKEKFMREVNESMEKRLKYHRK